MEKDPYFFLSKSRNSQLSIQRLILLFTIFSVLSANIFAQNSQPVTVKGTVIDDQKAPLAGAIVSLLYTTNDKTTKPIAKSVFSDENGHFQLELPAGAKEPIVRAAFLGMVMKEVKYTGQSNVIIQLSESNTLDEVVVEAGIIQRNKLGFTGAFTTVTQDEIKAVGNTNLLQSLKSLDPGFVISDNLSMGSDPNVMSNIEIRGKTSMAITTLQDQSSTVSANQPLFIMDGFEVSLQQVNDMDINRVESITLLKDAGSTAIYGAKGANGVVVIETVKPKAGQIMISYDHSSQLSFPDLGVYNLMNAAEKLEFEKLSERWGPIDDNTNVTGQQEYYRRLAMVKSGVDTYWLSEPVRNSYTHNHSLTISGGDKKLLFDVGLNYKNQEGVMKESSRETYGGNAKIVYRGIDNLNISNNAIISGTNALNGAWTTGNSFQAFAQATPYFKKRNDDGSISLLLDQTTDTQTQTTEYAYNPLYNATLNSHSDDKSFYFTNNTNIDWNVLHNLRVIGSLSLTRTNVDYERYIDPSNTMYATMTDYTKKGEYTSSTSNSWSVSGNLRAAYNFSLAEQHNFGIIARGALSEYNYSSKGFVAVGFPEGSIGNPSSAYSYRESSVPSYSKTTSREISSLIAVNYNFAYRYLFDFNYNIEGSTKFGRNKRFKDFWSVGLGWNLDKEPFAKDWEWLSAFKISGTAGINANQNVSTALTTSIYSFYPGNTQFGQGAYLSQFANPDLRWQEVKKYSLNIDGSFLNRRLNTTIGLYHHITDPMIISLPQKPSSGVSSYPLNMGKLTSKGIEFKLSYFPIYNIKEQFTLGINVSGAHGKEEYGSFSDALSNINESFLQGSTVTDRLNSLQFYEDGRSPSDIWAVRSMGIDPATGQEIYLTKEGKQTFTYDVNDRVVVGNTKPKIEGTFGFSLMYKKLRANLTFRYRLGGDAFNTALYNKVENISSTAVRYNQDKRALYDRWKNPGDIAEFKSIKITNYTSSQVTSRFVQRDNQLIAEAIKVSWDFTNDKWIKTLGMKDLTVGVSMNDIFRVSSIKMERGIDYPFARSVLFNLSTRF